LAGITNIFLTLKKKQTTNYMPQTRRDRSKYYYHTQKALFLAWADDVNAARSPAAEQTDKDLKQILAEVYDFEVHEFLLPSPCRESAETPDTALLNYFIRNQMMAKSTPSDTDCELLMVVYTGHATTTNDNLCLRR